MTPGTTLIPRFGLSDGSYTTAKRGHDKEDQDHTVSVFRLKLGMSYVMDYVKQPFNTLAYPTPRNEGPGKSFLYTPFPHG